MTIKLKSTDSLALRRFIPIASLPEQQFEEIVSKVSIEEGKKGALLFKQGDRKREFVYLLSGTIELRAGDVEMETVEAGSASGRFALAHQIPRKVSAIAISKVRFVRVDTSLLTIPSQDSDEQSSYEVSDIPEEDSDDWMTTLLQSPVFQRLPAANLQKVIMELEEVSLQAGNVLFTQGDVGDYYYIIKEGICALTRKASKNAKVFKLAELKSCDAFGEDALISDGKRNLTATMASDGVMLRLHKYKFLNLVKGPVIKYVDYDDAKENLGNRCSLIDVRGPEQFAQTRIKGSVNIPFFSIRMHLNGLSRNEQQIVVCEDGNTSEAAVFLLIRFGFDAVVLRDGILQIPESDLVGSGGTGEKPPQARSAPGENGIARSEGKEMESIGNGVTEAETNCPPENTTAIIQLKQKLEEREAHCISLQEQVDSLETQNAELVQRQTDFEKNIAELEIQSSSASDNVGCGKAELDSLAQELAQMTAECDLIRMNFQAQTDELGRIRGSDQESKKELSLVRQRNEVIEGELRMADSKIKEFEASIQTLAGENEQWVKEKETLRQEKNGLESSLRKQDEIDARLDAVQQLADDREQERILQETEFSQRIEEAQKREAELRNQVGLLTSEKDALEKKLDEKERMLIGRAAEVADLRDQEAFIGQQVSENQSGDSDHPQTQEKNDALSQEIAGLQKANRRIKNEKQLADEQVAALSAQVGELKSVIQAFLDQDDSHGYLEEMQSLKSELEMVRAQADVDVQAMRAELGKVREEASRVDIELEKEQQHSAELNMLLQKPTPVNPELTPVDRDVFDLLEDVDSRTDVVSEENAVPQKKRLFSWR